MSEKRMFSKTIVLSDTFLDMPATTRCLYFTLSMLADDEGFVNNPKSIMRQCGAAEDDFKILIAKYFIIPCESGVVVIRHWHINNYLRNDRFTPTKCTEEKKFIELKNGVYEKTDKPAEIIKPKKTRGKLIDREPKNELEEVEKTYLLQYKALYEKGILATEEPVINWTAARKQTNDMLSKFGKELLLKAIKKAVDDTWCVKGGYCLTTILSSGVFSRLINGKGGGVDEFELSDIPF